jgi:hypothetical protein
MSALVIALLGVYILLVGVRGNTGQFLEYLETDTPGFLPWAVSIGVIVILNEIPATQKLAAPFLFLMVLTFVLRNFENLRAQFNELQTAATGG